MKLLTMDPTAFYLGNWPVKKYGIIMAIAISVAFYLSVREGKKRGINDDHFANILLWGVPLGYLGARLYYVIFEWPYYANNPGQIFAIWQGGVAVYGGLLTGLLVLIVYCYYHALNLFKMLDIITPGVMLAQVIGRWGNFVNQEAHGARTTLTFLQSLHLPEFIIQGMKIGGHYYQPTFLYESFFNLLGFLIIIAVRHRKHFYRIGEVFFSYLAWYSLVRFFVEGMRTDSLYIFNTIRVSQALSVVLFVISVSLVIYRRKRRSISWYAD
ncbi:MAG: prolipoprotein diacylglyceryl transferase [Lactobacillus sp.]|nr:prolipoprotein diacylglyceryl transferase [Lactobacillus sp.]